MATFWERAVPSVYPLFFCIMAFVNLGFSRFDFEGVILTLIDPVPDHRLLAALIIH